MGDSLSELDTVCSANCMVTGAIGRKKEVTYLTTLLQHNEFEFEEFFKDMFYEMGKQVH